jgi:putative oxidoreductase
MPAPMLYTAGIIEFFGGVMLVFGIFVPLVAFITCGEMAVAYFMVHAPHAFLPIINQGELAVLFCFTFLFFAANGAGKWSVDSMIFKKKK